MLKKKILVIDDEESLRFTFDNFLHEEGYEVATAKNYEEALIEIAGRNFDVIFVDIILKGKTGVDVLREIRERGQDCPVVMITGYPSLETSREALRLGAFDYIPKPVNQETLLRVTKTALQHKALHDEKEKYRSNIEGIFRSVKDAIITVDKDLNVIEINQAAQKVCGIFRENVRGKALSSLQTGCVGACVNALSETNKKKQSVEMHHMECRHIHRSSQVVSVTTSPLLDKQGKFSGCVMVVRDETRLVDLERNLEERRQFHNFIGESEKMQEVYSLMEELADISTTVLLTGESGTGKELAVEALHYKGIRGSKPLVKVNCSVFPEGLLESELFGHVKGAFTGAVKDKIGRFQKAGGGTIFLDEIGDIAPRIQLRLLRVLQETVFERVGDSNPIKVDVRVVAATNQDLRKKVSLGQFREDLFYRLKVVEIILPPLRERREDIPLLTNHFLGKFNKKFNKKIDSISDEVQKMFMTHPWPGNIRELENVMEHASILCHQSIITLDNLPLDFKEFSEQRKSPVKATTMDDPESIIAALEKTGWNKAKAARLLGMDRKTIYRKIQKYGIQC